MNGDLSEMVTQKQEVQAIMLASGSLERSYYFSKNEDEIIEYRSWRASVSDIAIAT